MMKGLNLRYEAISKIDPENNTLETKGGNKVTYDYLITAPGLVLRYDKIEGAMDALQDPNSPVGSIYMMDYAYKTSRIREEFKGGNAIFMIP
jgi:NADPH-dependent 2,4-dienoyl-CoA reductase/sulfur reductase-like enzyme